MENGIGGENGMGGGGMGLREVGLLQEKFT